MKQNNFKNQLIFKAYKKALTNMVAGMFLLGMLIYLSFATAQPLDPIPQAQLLEALKAQDLELRPKPQETQTTSKTLLVMGDSISAEYGLAYGTGWVNLLRAKIREQFPDHTVINASISGETSQGVLSRLPRLLRKHEPDIVVVEIGANDAMYGASLEGLTANLEQILQLALTSGALAAYFELPLPPNFGSRFLESYFAALRTAAKDKQVLYVSSPIPEFVGWEQWGRFIQADGLHPNEQAQPLLRDWVWQNIEPYL